MKLRIDPTQIRFRLSLAEANQLLTEGVLAETLLLPLGKGLNYQVKISDKLALSYIGNSVILNLNKRDLQNLIQNPSKKGLSSNYKEQDKIISFSLQIDMPCDFNC